MEEKLFIVKRGFFFLRVHSTDLKTKYIPKDGPSFVKSFLFHIPECHVLLFIINLSNVTFQLRNI